MGREGHGGPAAPGRSDPAGPALNQVTGSGPVLHHRTGFELELLAPRGSSRETLAVELARRCDGTVQPVFHADSEPSLVPGMGQFGHFLHLTKGFEVRDGNGALLCTLVDDVTLTADLDPRAAPRPGWYRVLTDDARLLRLLARQADPAATLDSVLDPVADLFGVVPEAIGQVRRLTDQAGATIALAAPSPGERERPCEVVTPPLVSGHRDALARLLEPAAALGFSVPAEAAVHLHLDAAPFASVEVFANVVRLFGHWGPALREVLGTNPRCRRLAPLPVDLLTLVEQPWTGPDAWQRLRAAARDTGVTKFFDVNLTGLLRDRPRLPTLEVRVLPGSLDAGDVVRRAALVGALLDRCLRPEPLPLPPGDPSCAVGELLALAAPVAA